MFFNKTFSFDVEHNESMYISIDVGELFSLIECLVVVEHRFFCFRMSNIQRYYALVVCCGVMKTEKRPRE